MEIDVSLRKCYYNNNLYDLKYLENEVRTMSSLDKQIDFTENSCKDFIDVLASSAPIPGGGGASALVGAIGVALGNMVGSLTVGKKRYADVEEDIIRCKKEADEIIQEVISIINEISILQAQQKAQQEQSENLDKNMKSGEVNYSDIKASETERIDDTEKMQETIEKIDPNNTSTDIMEQLVSQTVEDPDTPEQANEYLDNMQKIAEDAKKETEEKEEEKEEKDNEPTLWNRRKRPF